MKTEVTLTVSESKRLIGKGVAEYKPIKKALEKGIVNIPSGTTNGYVIEEILGKDFDKKSYVTGRTLPAKKAKQLNKKIKLNIPDVVLRNGDIDKDLDRASAMEKMKKGDIFIKGGNALNYQRGVVGILLGQGRPGGGTIGAAIGHIINKRIELVIPIGLEKEISANIYEIAKNINNPHDSYRGYVNALWPVEGTIITEIEAINILTGVTAHQMAAGGIGGAEGAARLLLEGSKSKLDETLAVIDGIHGEPPFIE